ncbi:hypothetical protein Tco_1156075 [Tanacetum coccineum]
MGRGLVVYLDNTTLKVAICLIEDPYYVLPRRDSVHFIAWLCFVSRIGCVLSKVLHCDLLLAFCLPLKTYIAFWWKETLAKFLLLCSIDQGPFELGTTRNTLGTTPEGSVLLGPERPRTYDDLSDNEKKRYRCRCPCNQYCASRITQRHLQAHQITTLKQKHLGTTVK